MKIRIINHLKKIIRISFTSHLDFYSYLLLKNYDLWYFFCNFREGNKNKFPSILLNNINFKQ